MGLWPSHWQQIDAGCESELRVGTDSIARSDIARHQQRMRATEGLQNSACAEGIEGQVRARYAGAVRSP